MKLFNTDIYQTWAPELDWNAIPISNSSFHTRVWMMILFEINLPKYR